MMFGSRSEAAVRKEAAGRRPFWRHPVLNDWYSTPSRYEPTGTPLSRRTKVAREAGVRLALLFALVFIETIVFAPVSGAITRWMLRLVKRSHIAAIRPGFDGSFYLRQFAGTSRERQVSSDPLLHYAILGWREGRAPSAGFDPSFFGRRNPGLPRNVDPLLLHARSNRAGMPCHELVERRRNLKWNPDLEGVLTIHHARGGGSGTFLALFEEYERELNFNVFRLRALPGGQALGALDEIVESTGSVHPHVFDLARGLTELAEYCRSRRIVRLVVNHVIDRPPEVLNWIKNLSRMLECEYEVILHDYYALCPRVNMVTGMSEFCDTAPPEACAVCTANYGSEVKGFDPHSWRRDFLAFLEGASQLIVPSADLGARLQLHLPASRISVWRPEGDDRLPAERKPRLAVDEPLRVLSIGALSVPKGANVLASLAHQAASSDKLLTFKLIGDGADARRLQLAGVQVTGFYKQVDLDGLINIADPHIVFFPSIWPETWSFVLTSALRRGLPIVAFDIGAPAERLRALGRGHLLPLELANRPMDLLKAFSDMRSQWVNR
ncbi:glycosyltransferase [Reyranella sp.]|uniref:glycosyltransferase n=1 Tax=Reyranella sp. TaxID=1929291 RepID=UPI003D0A29B7